MTNISAVSTPKNQSIESRANATRLSNDIEDVIEKIECLRLVWDQRGNKQCFSVDEIGRRKDFRRFSEYSGVSTCRIPNDTINDSQYLQTRGQEQEKEQEQEQGQEQGQEQEQEQDQEQEQEQEPELEQEQAQNILIERGPIKSQFCSPTRNQPYWSTAERSRHFEANDTFMIDYEKTVEQILRDKEYGEKLNACLDQLEDFEKANWSYYSDVTIANACPVKSLTRDLPLAATIAEDYSSDDTLLLENVLCGSFQEAQRVTKDALLGDPNPADRAPETEARESSRAQSPAAAARADSPRTSQQTFVYSPISATSSMYRPAQILPYSSSSSSSSSSQSYADTPSPNSSYRTLLAPRIEPQIGEDRENFSLWEQDRELPRNNIDDDDLWTKVVEELVNGIEEERTKVESDGSTVEVLLPCYSRDNVDFSSLVRSLGNDTPSAVDLAINSPDFEYLKAERSITRTRDDFEIPKMVASFESRSRRRCNSDRSIMPWPSLNLPSVKASERLKEKLNPREVEKAMISLLKRPVDELAKQDKDGDTMLMCLVGNPDELVEKMAYLAPLVERLSAVTGALTITNDRGEDALYLAALNSPQFPYVAGYLAATMVEKGIDVSQRLYHTRGDTLIHSIAARGDSHGETLAELLALTTIQGNAVFDLSKRNYDGRTALHVAIESHDPLAGGTVSVATVKLLLKYGADPRMKETKCGDTALHMAASARCDPALVKVLLDASSFVLVNAVNYNHDTPLHTIAAAANNVPLERLKEVCWLFLQAGGQTNVPNRQGKTPLALVSSERKDVVRKIFYKRSR